jgi:thymidylate kinase
MKIAICGCQASGKTFLIKEFIQKWSMYKTPEKTYRDIIKSRNIKINQEGDEESQKAILNALIDEVQQAQGDFLIFDRCVVDNIAYTLWLNAHDKVSDKFVMDSKFLALQTLKLFDILFYVPLREEIKIEEKDNRDTDPEFRKEIDNIFRALVLSYEKGTGAFFPTEDCPAVITLEGPPDLRCEQIRLYLKDNGKFFTDEDGSLLS